MSVATVAPSKELNPVLAGTSSPTAPSYPVAQDVLTLFSRVVPPFRTLAGRPCSLPPELGPPADAHQILDLRISQVRPFLFSQRVFPDARFFRPPSPSHSILSEIIAGHVAGSPPPPLSAKERTGFYPLDVLKQNHKALKLGLYGFFVSAPLGHTLLAILQRVFKGKTSARAKLLMIVCSNLFISPIQQSAYSAFLLPSSLA